MKRRQMSDVQHLQPISQSLSHSLETVNTNKKDPPASVLTKLGIATLQSQLQSLQGYSLTPGSIVYISHYCDYHTLLKEIIISKQQIKSPKSGFLKEYSRMHSQDSVSKLFNQLVNKDHEMRKNSKMYSQQCLSGYFHLKEFSDERLIATLLRRIVDGKRKGLIEIEEKRKNNNKSYYQLDYKENKSRLCFGESKQKVSFEQNKLYYSILTLKLLLKETFPNMQQINTICEEIKVNLELFLANLKLRQKGKTITLHRSSILRRE